MVIVNKKPLILIVDDEGVILTTLKDALEDEGCIVYTILDGTKAIDVIGKLVPDLIFLDICMPSINGIDLLTKIKKEYPQQKVIMISGFGNIPLALEAINKGALDFIEKPLNLDDILSKIAFLKKDLHDEEHVSKDSYEHDYERYGIVGKSFLFQELMRHVQQVAKLSFPVLIYGEHGCGKSLIAQYIHSKSLLDSKKFVTIDCAAGQIFDTSLLEVGTFYFKNIQELPRDEQKKMVAWLEHSDFSKARVIASSNHPLFDLVKQGTFNEALFHALNVTPLEVPSLNKRRYDIPLLVQHFVDIENEKQQKQIVFSNSSIRLLRNHSWTGNIQELKQCVKKVIVLSPHDYFVATFNFLRKFLFEKEIQFIEEQQFTTFSTLRDATNAFEKTFLLYYLKKNNYDLIQVSDRLNLNLPQLRAKMLELNIELNR